MDIFELIKKDRFDLSDYLIHFTNENETKKSFEVLKDIISSGKIECGWSIRNGKRTVFGSAPAICFTDMPLYSFFKYVHNRKDKSKVDFYAVIIPKKNYSIWGQEM